MARPKKTTARVSSLDEANAALRALLSAEIELEKLSGAVDLARASATAKYEGDIDAAKTRIADLNLQLQNWYVANSAELETNGRKSIQLLYGVIGRRKGNPALKPLNRTWNWQAVGVKLRSLFGTLYFHALAEPAIDRERVRTSLTVDQLKACGLKVENEERFFIETDRKSIEGTK